MNPEYLKLEDVAARIRGWFREWGEAGGGRSPGQFPTRRYQECCDSEERAHPLRLVVQKLCGEAERMAAREREIVDLLGCSSPELIVHAVRNLQNDVVLLGALLKEKDGDRFGQT